MPIRTEPLQAGGLPIRTLRVVVHAGADSSLAPVVGETLTIGTARDNDLVLTDRTVSRYHAELSASRDGIVVRDVGSTNGIRASALRIERGVVPPGSVLTLGATEIRVDEGQPTKVELLDGHRLCGLIGQSAQMRRLMAQIERIAPSGASVLAIGESGTGKELIASALHELSPRRKMPFVTVDCGALTPTLVASELFGHEKGAFTGADRRHTGAFERAHGGTLFLDEIGELPESLQVNLLGVLERGQFRRLGGQDLVSVDVRVVSATNRDLRAEVNQGRFRLDLYYRLAVVTLQVPALRERSEDVPLLVEHFLRDCGEDAPLSSLLPESALQMLQNHHWPGNVRELRNWVEATLAIGEPMSLRTGDATAAAGVLSSSGADLIESLLRKPYKEARNSLVGEFELRYLQALLERCENNVSKAARTARMDRSHLSEMLKRHNLR